MKNLIFLTILLLSSCTFQSADDQSRPQPFKAQFKAPKVNYTFNQHSECDEYQLPDPPYSSKITVCQELDRDSEPAELIFNKETGVLILEIKPIKDRRK